MGGFERCGETAQQLSTRDSKLRAGDRDGEDGLMSRLRPRYVAESGDCRIYILYERETRSFAYVPVISWTVMGKRKLAPNEEVIDLTTPSSQDVGASGSSQQQQQQASQTSPSKAKRLRKNPQKSDVPPPEKRGAMFKKACPKNILERVARVMSQR